MEPVSKTRSLSSPFTRLLTSSTLVAGARVAGAVLGISLQIVLARSFGAESLGVFYLVMAVASVLSVVCTLGYPMLVAKVVAESSERGNVAWLTEFLQSARRDVLIASSLAALSAGMIILFVPSLSTSLRIGLVIGVLTVPVAALFRLNSALANAHRYFLTGFFPELIGRPFLLLLATIAMVQLIADTTIIVVIAVNFALVCGVSVWQYGRIRALQSTVEGATDPATSRSSESLSIGKTQTVLWRRDALQLSVAAVFMAVFADLSILMASVFLEQTDLGIFGTCLRVSFFVAFAIQAIHQICFRDMADALQQENRTALRASIARGNVIALTISIVALVGISLFATPILNLFGPEFVEGRNCLIVLMLAQILRASAGPATQILALTGHGQTTIPIYLISVLLLGILGAALIPTYGINGAAVVVVSTTAFWSYGLMFLANRHEGLNSAVLR